MLNLKVVIKSVNKHSNPNKYFNRKKFVRNSVYNKLVQLNWNQTNDLVCDQIVDFAKP